MIRTIWKKGKLKFEMTRKIWWKSKSNSDKIWKIWNKWVELWSDI